MEVFADFYYDSRNNDTFKKSFKSSGKFVDEDDNLSEG
eukprot:CAMPEP_0116935942 /NCGR_PEP_ID=MMETSP0467-20121206/30590_1 /TAXON_ID=283647 /ORGANISM="Mesodinium pulex, Strain SPMC105" /LENGTH=37 /DNA_ID= /DNA_START= /DNA_END= /DNA_ORIENTATION=